MVADTAMNTVPATTRLTTFRARMGRGTSRARRGSWGATGGSNAREILGSGGFDASWFNSVSGATYAWSAVAAIVAFVLGLAVTRPLGARMGALAAEMARAPDDATRAALGGKLAAAQKWMSAVGMLLTILLVLSAAGMSVARYLR